MMQNGYPPINVKFVERRKYSGRFEESYKNGKSWLQPLHGVGGEPAFSKIQAFLVLFFAIGS